MVKPAEDFNGQEDEGNQTSRSFPSRQLEPVQTERSEVEANLQRKAEFEANVKYDSDLQNVLDRGGEWPTEKALEREASNKANVALRPYVDTDIDIESTKRFYIRHYARTYRAFYERDTNNKTLPNDETKQVQHIAQQDARNDREESVDFSSEAELNYQAAIRIQELFEYRTRASSGYLTYIMGHIPTYKQAYREEKDRLAGGSFLAGQSGR